ncbi:hypothetical protein XELAEV_18026287mg [Xenopus laevis]|uniref:Uncharacterized protein n=1 Tax=Xenopus laevis TaxID=8355 RepID=A0A974CU27_XENLA|nr:hypothetical protein XELAEV_18026287mg [Xenopus laevis]
MTQHMEHINIWRLNLWLPKKAGATSIVWSDILCELQLWLLFAHHHNNIINKINHIWMSRFMGSRETGSPVNHIHQRYTIH